MDKRTNDEEQNASIYNVWYSFGVRAKQLLTDVQKIDTDNFSVKDFEYLQNACETAIRSLNEKLAEHLKQFPD